MSLTHILALHPGLPVLRLVLFRLLLLSLVRVRLLGLEHGDIAPSLSIFHQKRHSRKLILLAEEHIQSPFQWLANFQTGWVVDAGFLEWALR